MSRSARKWQKNSREQRAPRTAHAGLCDWPSGAMFIHVLPAWVSEASLLPASGVIIADCHHMFFANFLGYDILIHILVGENGWMQICTCKPLHLWAGRDLWWVKQALWFHLSKHSHGTPITNDHTVLSAHTEHIDSASPGNNPNKVYKGVWSWPHLCVLCGIQE